MPVLHELLRYFKVVVSLQKETLINQCDPCTRMYILRAGSLQAAATDKLMAQAAGQEAGGGGGPSKGKGKGGKMGGKAKMQVRMIERPGDVICCASPFEPPQPLPFQVTSLKRTMLVSIHMQDLLTILDMVSEEQTDAICKTMHAEHRNILLSVMPKSKTGPAGGGEATGRESRASVVDPNGNDGADSARLSASTEKFEDKDLGERRLEQLEGDIERCVSAMAELHKQAKTIPRVVQALSLLHAKPLPSMGPHATAALLKSDKDALAAVGPEQVGSPADSEPAPSPEPDVA